MPAKTRKFKAEMKQLMDIIVHSLYSNREVFLRELISNAVDAVDRARFEGLTNPEILEDNSDWKIKIAVDADAGTLTVSDNGIGMSAETVVDQLGSIAKSGTTEFLANLQKEDSANRPELIGQFGVGFYASFMVADQVRVESRMAGDVAAGVRWVSQGEGTYTIETITKQKRGTDVTLHLRDDAKEFLEPFQLQAIIKRFSDFIEHPIVMDVERAVEPTNGEADARTETVEETFNARQAIWLRPKNEITDDEYHEFYKHLSRDLQDPVATIHYVAEGNLEFRALLFLPAKRPPFFLADDPTKQGPHLYIRRVMISDNAEDLLPAHLRFVRGVVDCDDLPLNVSREMLQDNPIVAQIRKALTNKILQTMETMAAEEPEKYAALFTEWGPLFKTGVYTDFANRERLTELLRFQSTRTKPGTYTTLAAYFNGMPVSQKEIYYLLGPNREMLDRSPYLEAARARDQEVLLMTDPVDEWVVSTVHSYKDKPLKAVDRGEMAADDQQAGKAADERFKGVLEFLAAKVPEVKLVRLSSRLKESAAVLVVEEGALNAHMEAMFKSMGRTDVPETKRILELNADHAAVTAVRELFEADPEDARLADYARLLYDQAVLAEGSPLLDPLAFAARINDLIAKDAANTAPSKS